MTPADLLTSTGVPVVRSAGWWRRMAADCDAAAMDADLPRSMFKTIGGALDKIDHACEGRDDEDSVTVVFTEGEKAVLDEGDWLSEVER